MNVKICGLINSQHYVLYGFYLPPHPSRPPSLLEKSHLETFAHVQQLLAAVEGVCIKIYHVVFIKPIIYIKATTKIKPVGTVSSVVCCELKLLIR